MDDGITVKAQDLKGFEDLLEGLEDYLVEIERSDDHLVSGYAAVSDDGIYLRGFTSIVASRSRSQITAFVAYEDIKSIEVL